MNNHQGRRDRIAAQVLAGMMADPSVDGHPNEFAVSAIEFADALIAELDRTAPPSNQPESPEGWVIWDDFEDVLPVLDQNRWHRPSTPYVVPFATRRDAVKALADLDASADYRVRKWPLDPAEDKPEVKP